MNLKRGISIGKFARLVCYLFLLAWVVISSVGWGNRNGRTGCAPVDRFLNLDEQNVPDDRSFHELVLDAAQTRLSYHVAWVNRDFVLTDDGSFANFHGLGYSGSMCGGAIGDFPLRDDIYSFEEKLREFYSMGMHWSDYPYGCCDASPYKFRPGCRWYSCRACSLLEGGRWPYCWPEDWCPEFGPTCQCQGGYPTEDMRYFWAGSACYDFVAFVLEEADFSRFGGIAEKCTSALWLFNYILSHGYGYETHDRDDPQLQQPGNLIMMDITHNGDFSDHIGIFTEKGDEFAHDRTMGNFGFYSSPFYYRAHDANMQDFNDALEAEWPPYTDPDPDSGWCVHERYVKYIIIYGT